MTTRTFRNRDLRELLRRVINEAEYIKDLGGPSDVEGGAVWTDPAGKLTGDLQTSRGPVSFCDATVGHSTPPDPQLNLPVPCCNEHSKAILETIRTHSEAHDVEEALKGIMAIRDHLAGCLELAEKQISLLSERLELADLVTPDTDPVRRVTGVRARHVPDDGPVTCDPDEHFTD